MGVLVLPLLAAPTLIGSTSYASLCPCFAQGDAAKLLAAGFGVYAAFYTMAVWNDKASKQPFVVRECQPLASRV